jgi:hypothetical protein
MIKAKKRENPGPKIIMLVVNLIKINILMNTRTLA